MDDVKEGTLVSLDSKAPDVSQLQTRGQKLIETANSFVIEDQEQLNEVVEWTRGIKKDRAFADELLDGWVDAAHKEHKARLAIKKKYVGPIDEAERIAKEKMGAAQKKINDAKEAERRRIEAEAREKERLEREERERKLKEEREAKELELKLAREKSEKVRKEREAEAAELAKIGNTEAAAKAKADAELKAKQDKEKADKEAAELKAKQDKERAEAAEKEENDRKEREKAAAKAAKEKTAGMSVSQKWYAAVDSDENLLELAKAVVAGTVPVKALAPGQKWLNDYAQSNQDAVPIPGVRFYHEDKVAVR
jgi:hypothetical protein